MKTLLVSVTDKSGLDNFLRRVEKHWELRLLATASTARYLLEAGFKVETVESFTKSPEILGGRVKTLHPRVFAGILARPDAEDVSCLESMDIPAIDMVIVNLYRFEDKLKENLSESEMIEQIDIGGVALLRAAAKNFNRVAVVSDPSQYEGIVGALAAGSGQLEYDFRKRLSFEAFARTARYDQSIATYLHERLNNDEDSRLPGAISINLTRYESLRYGENPHQAAGWYMASSVSPAGVMETASSASFPPFEQLQGKEMSSNNITDTFAAVSIIRDIKTPAACIIKHNNPCGVAVGSTIEDAFAAAHACDPVSAFGGVIGLTEKVGGDLAAKICENFVEIVVAKDFDQAALDVFKKKKNVRVLKLHKDGLQNRGMHCKIRDLQDFGFIVERGMESDVDASQFKCVTKKQVDPKHMSDIAFGWGIAKHLTSNAILICRDHKSIGFGIGQTSRIAAVQHALNQAGKAAQGAVLISDGFFPATDNIEAAAKAGITVIVQPGGSIKDDDVIKACDDAGIAMLFTGQRCFKH